MSLAQMLVWGALGLVLLFWVMISFFYSCSGVWKRCDEEAKNDPYKKEKIKLAQFGPVVVGRSELKRGLQKYFGFAFGRQVYLSRRDFGEKLFLKQGFPENLLPMLEGRVMGKLSLKVSNSGLKASGAFTAFKVEFDRTPPKVKKIYPYSKSPRSYKRVERISETALKKVVGEHISGIPQPTE